MHSSPSETAQSATRNHDSLFDSYIEPEWKTPEWLHSPKKDTATEQLAYAQKREEAGRLSSACSEYDALVRQWPTSPEAPIAQIALARVYVARNQKDKAFREYQYAILMFPNAIAYEHTVQTQMDLLRAMEDELGTGFLGLGETLSADYIARLYQVVAQNSPASDRAPECYFRMGELYASDFAKDYDLALEPYDTVLARYPQSTWAPLAAYRAARARVLISRSVPRDIKRARSALHSISTVLQTHATALAAQPEALESLRAWHAEMSQHLANEEYQQAAFYDTIRHKPESAIVAYRRFLELHPKGPNSDRARARLAELEARPAPSKPAPSHP